MEESKALNDVDRSMLRAVTPFGFVKAAGLAVMPLALAALVADRVDVSDLRRWVAAVWLGAALQLGLLLARRRLWERSEPAWERVYGWVELFSGATWSAALAVDTTGGDPLTYHLIVVCSSMLLASAGVVAFAGSPRVGRRLLAGLWGGTTLIALAERHLEVAGIAMLLWPATLLYLSMASRLLRGSTTEHQRSRRLSIDLAIQASTDGLTGLLDRRATLQRAQHAIDRSDGVTVLFIDLDDFTAINNQYGYTTGDTVLTNVAHCLADVTRPDDIVGRVGGDEFMVVLTDPADQHLGDAIAERLAGEIARCHGPIPELMVTASVGAARSIFGASSEDLLGCADSAMQRAKSQGGNVAVPYLEAHLD